MGFIYNPTTEPAHVIAFGNHFTMKPGQIKNFQDHISDFLASERGEFGLVSLPDAFEDPEYQKSEEGQAIMAAKKAEGIAARIRKLKEIVYNNQVSLKQDLEIRNLKVDPRTLASDGELAAMVELAKYQDAESDEAQKKVEKIKALEKKIGKVER